METVTVERIKLSNEEIHGKPRGREAKPSKPNKEHYEFTCKKCFLVKNISLQLMTLDHCMTEAQKEMLKQYHYQVCLDCGGEFMWACPKPEVVKC